MNLNELSNKELYKTLGTVFKGKSSLKFSYVEEIKHLEAIDRKNQIIFNLVIDNSNEDYVLLNLVYNINGTEVVRNFHEYGSQLKSFQGREEELLKDLEEALANYYGYYEDMHKFGTKAELIDFGMNKDEDTKLTTSHFTYTLDYIQKGRNGKITNFPLTIKKYRRNMYSPSYSVSIDFTHESFETKELALEKMSAWYIRMGKALKEETEKGSFESVSI